MESNAPPAIAKRLLHIIRTIYYMMRKGVSKGKLMVELHLLLKRGKIAGKAIGNILAFHHHHHHHTATSLGGGRGVAGGMYSAFSCRSMDPNLSYYDPREVEFSCSNTPYYPSFIHATKRKNKFSSDFSSYDAVTVAKVFDILNEVSDSESVVASPSPAGPAWSCGKTPPVRQLRITDSPFPIKEEGEGEVDGHVDVAAEEFIKRFYEQLRLQTMTGAATPECRSRRRGGWIPRHA